MINRYVIRQASHQCQPIKNSLLSTENNRLHSLYAYSILTALQVYGFMTNTYVGSICIVLLTPQDHPYDMYVRAVVQL